MSQFLQSETGVFVAIERVSQVRVSEGSKSYQDNYGNVLAMGDGKWWIEVCVDGQWVRITSLNKKRQAYDWASKVFGFSIEMSDKASSLLNIFERNASAYYDQKYLNEEMAVPLDNLDNLIRELEKFGFIEKVFIDGKVGGWQFVRP